MKNIILVQEEFDNELDIGNPINKHIVSNLLHNADLCGIISVNGKCRIIKNRHSKPGVIVDSSDILEYAKGNNEVVAKYDSEPTEAVAIEVF